VYFNLGIQLGTSLIHAMPIAFESIIDENPQLLCKCVQAKHQNQCVISVIEDVVTLQEILAELPFRGMGRL
jgi:hypothetical protein